MDNIVHIGLGKTATTTLQRWIFPKLAADNGYVYNEPELKSLLVRSIAISPMDEQTRRIRYLLARQRNFISIESLVNWNPAQWEAAADKNLALFGKETKILLSLRDPLSWMRSVYQQMIHEGHIFPPETFFLPEREYIQASQLTSPGHLEYFCPDYLDFERLFQIYVDRFDFVECGSVNHIAKMDFAQSMFGVDDEYRRQLQATFKSSKRENRAYSHMAMNLTFQRERLLRALGAKSIGSADWRYEELESLWQSGGRSGPGWSDLTVGQKLRNFPGKLRKRLNERQLNWRWLMENYVDTIIPYKEYSLPPSVYVNQDTIEKSRRFIKVRSDG